MAKRNRPSPPEPAAPPQPTESAFSTTEYEDVKKLYAAGITAVDTHGVPLVFVYAPHDRARIKAVLG